MPNNSAGRLSLPTLRVIERNVCYLKVIGI